MTEFFNKWEIRDVFAFCSTARAQSGFSFVDRCLDKYPQGTLRKEATSPPYSRQINILLAYNFELLLDSLAFMYSPENTEGDLIKYVKVNHNLNSLWEKIKDKENLFGITDIKKSKKGLAEFYEIEIKNKKIIIHDFLNIRYDIGDFRVNKTNKLRSNESEELNMVEVLKISKALTKDIMDYLDKKYQIGP